MSARRRSYSLELGGADGRDAGPEPYGQTVVRVDAARGYLLVGAGGGGGSALLFPSAKLDPIVAGAEAGLPFDASGSEAASLRGLFLRVDDAMAKLTHDPQARYGKSSAEAVAALAGESACAVLAVGRTRAYELDDEGELGALTVDDTPHSRGLAVAEVVVPPLFRHLEIEGLGVERKGELRTQAVVFKGGFLDRGDFVLVTSAMHEALPHGLLTTLAREAFATADLSAAARVFWDKGHTWLEAHDASRDARRSRYAYRRRAAVGLVRTRAV